MQEPKKDDYQTLVAKIRTLEIEVKLLKEAFLVHMAVTTGQPHTPQRPVLSNALKNSDLYAPSPKCSMAPAARVDKHSPLPQNPNQNPLNSMPRCYPQQSVPLEQVESKASSIPTGRPTASTASTQTANANDMLAESSKSVVDRRANHPLAYATWEHIRTSGLKDELSPEAIRQLVEDSRAADIQFMNFHKEAEAMIKRSASALNVSGVETSCNPSTKTFPSAVSPPTPQQSSSKSLMDLEPEAEIARFPTIFQLEKENLESMREKRSPQEASSNSTRSLARANTVTGSNPAARLLKPFDPATEGPSSQSHLPRRSGTEPYRRRPYAEQFSGAGRTLWEEFERSGPKPQEKTVQETTSNTPNSFRKPRSRPLDDPPSYHDYSPLIRSNSLNQPSNPRSHRLPPMRSVIDLPGISADHQGWNNPNLPGHRLATANSTPNLVQPPAPASHDKRPKKVESCIHTLEEMGYKPKDMIPVYAEACDGNIIKAVSMAEEDQKATQLSITRVQKMKKVMSCIRQLEEMGYGYDEQVKKVAREVEGDVARAVERIEAGERETGGATGMPGSFP